MLKILLEVIPLAVFFLSFKIYDLYYATSILMLSMVVCVIIQFIIYRNIPRQSLVSLLIVCGFGAITLITKDTNFIKMKITLINLIFAGTLLIGIYYKKLFLKQIMGNSINLSDKNWIKFSIRWALFFIIIAIANEYIRRSFSNEIWANFKVFGTLSLSLLFIGSQIPFLMKNSLNNKI